LTHRNSLARTSGRTQEFNLFDFGTPLTFRVLEIRIVFGGILTTLLS
jgi:hypothetical protein